ncbi:hypothetical protein GINT2_000553 [Glugoides intestinalis]
MNMKKEIYQLLTIENGIRLSTVVLNYLSENLRDIAELTALLKLFKAQYNTDSISLDQIKNLSIQKKETQSSLFNVKSFKYIQKDLAKEFERVKSNLSLQITPISLLESNTKQVIFGIFFKGKDGRYAIEDDYDIIELDLSNVKADVFLFEDMFVCLKGVKSSDFCVDEVILPPCSIYNSTNGFLKDIGLKICAFGSFNDEIDFVRSVLINKTPDICLISCSNPFDSSSISDICPNIIVCSSSTDKSYLPSQVQQISNPYLIETFKHLICFLDADVFENRKTGLFFNENHMEAFLRTLASQQSLCPFSGSDLYVPYFPNIMIIAQDSYPVVLDVDGIKFMNLPPVKDHYFAFLDFSNNLFEIKCG